MNAMDKLKRAADDAYNLYPNSCSHAVWHVVKQYNPGQIYMTANILLSYIECDPRWKPVKLTELATLAAAGELIVGGLSDNPNGHVVIVYPGTVKMAGGYSVTRNNKTITVGSKGPYALVMSTSLGSWPGAKSKGDKTVWDPWGKDQAFIKVKFWHYDAMSTAPAAACKK